MTDLWWRMPGPARFTCNTVEQLRDGKSVVLCMPQHMPAGIDKAIVKGYEPPQRRGWQGFQIASNQRSEPVEILFRQFVRSAKPTTLRNVRSLVQQPEFTRRLIWIQGFTDDNWPAWRSFFEEYEYQCRVQPTEAQTLFCIVLEGQLALQPPSAGIIFSHMRWQGIVEDIDTLLYTSVIMPRGAITGAKRRLAISIISGLALWDPLVCDALTRLPFRMLLQPIKYLQDIAEVRRWQDVDTCERWCMGMVDDFANQVREHSAALALLGRFSEIEQRIWSAQTGVLFPLIEERRHEILDSLQDLLILPFRTKEGVEIKDVYDLEVGHIEWMLREIKRKGFNDPRINKFLPQVSRLKIMRNRLAHFKALDEDKIYI